MSAVCPMCHRGNSARAKECEDCGYVFGQSVEALRGLLLKQLTSSRITMWVLVVVDLALIGTIVLAARYGMVLLPMMPIVFMIWQTYKAATKVSITKHSLRLIEQQPLPKATLRSR